MHLEVMDWVARCVARLTSTPSSVVDLGGRNVNGTTKELLPSVVSYVVVDIADGDGVDVIADAATWQPAHKVDLVLCTEVLEHTPAGAEIVANACNMLRPGGVLILTAAAPGRGAHGAHGASNPAPGEWYQNVDPDDLNGWLSDAGFRHWEIDVQASPSDVRAIAWK